MRATGGSSGDAGKAPTPTVAYAVNRGDRVAQLVLIQVEEAAFDLVADDRLGAAARGSGGFGHSGR